MFDRAVKPGSDEALMLRYAKGDMEAFQRLYERHRGGLYRYFLRQSNQSVAEELFQDVRAVNAIVRRRHLKPGSTRLPATGCLITGAAKVHVRFGM